MQRDGALRSSTSDEPPDPVALLRSRTRVPTAEAIPFHVGAAPREGWTHAEASSDWSSRSAEHARRLRRSFRRYADHGRLHDVCQTMEGRIAFTIECGDG